MGIAALAAVAILLVVGIGADQLAPGHWLNPLTHMRTASNTQPLPPLSECGSEACWGVIVEKNGGVFARVKEGSKEEAEAGALSLCARRLGAAGCRVLAVVSRKECWALAELATDRNKWKAAPGVTLDEAKLLATNECERSFGVCRVDMTFCADGSQRVGGMD
jgi:hypothetical protein